MLRRLPWARTTASVASLLALCATLAACGDLDDQTTEGAEVVVLSPTQQAAYDQMVSRLVSPTLPGASELDLYWRGEMAALRPGQAFNGIDAVTAYEGTGSATDCGELEVGNAFYCPTDESIAFDDNLLRTLFRDLGAGGPTLILAHEYGHHISKGLGFPEFSVQAELQADCFAGQFMGSALDRGTIGYDGLLGAGAGLFVVGDKNYSSSQWFAPNVHGPYWVRARAFLDGATGGYDYCGGYAGWTDTGSVTIGSYSWLPSPTLGVGTRTDGALTLTTTDTRTVMASGDEYAGSSAQQAIPFVALSWFAGLSPQFGRVVDVPTAGLLGGSAAVQPYAYRTDAGPVHGLLFLHVAPGGQTAVVSTFADGEATSLDPDDPLWTPLATPLFVTVFGLCPPQRDGAMCPAD